MAKPIPQQEEKVLGADAAADVSAGSSDTPQLTHVAPMHSPAPWRVADCLGPGYLEVVMDDNDPGVCVVAQIGEQSSEDEEYANAHLISAAPELYEALKEIVAVLRREAPGTVLNGPAYTLLGIKANNALAKAEGSR